MVITILVIYLKIGMIVTVPGLGTWSILFSILCRMGLYVGWEYVLLGNRLKGLFCFQKYFEGDYVVYLLWNCGNGLCYWVYVERLNTLRACYVLNCYYYWRVETLLLIFLIAGWHLFSIIFQVWDDINCAKYFGLGTWSSILSFCIIFIWV